MCWYICEWFQWNVGINSWMLEITNKKTNHKKNPHLSWQLHWYWFRNWKKKKESRYSRSVWRFSRPGHDMAAPLYAWQYSEIIETSGSHVLTLMPALTHYCLENHWVHNPLLYIYVSNEIVLINQDRFFPNSCHVKYKLLTGTSPWGIVLLLRWQKLC